MPPTMTSALEEAIEDLAELLRADGATLQTIAVDAVAPSVELTISFDGVDCEDCVLPPDRLLDTASLVISKHAGARVGVILHDPRRTQARGADQPPTPSTMLEVLDPTGVGPKVGAPNPGPAAGSLRGKTVAIRHDILWRSFDLTVEEWQRMLEDAGATVLRWRRVQGLTGPQYEHAQAEYEGMLAKADVAISGLANCGSCTSWSVRDALTAAGRGLPTTAVVTAHFEPLAQVLAEEGGRPGLRLMVLPYPYDTLSDDEVRTHARTLFPQLLQTLEATL